MSSVQTSAWRWGLRARIVVFTSAVFGITLAAAFLWSVYNLRVVLEERNDTFLRHELSEFSGALAESVSDPQRQLDLPAAFRHMARAAREDGLLVLLRHDGRTIAVTDGNATECFEQGLGTPDFSETPRTIIVAGVPAGVRVVAGTVPAPKGNDWTLVLGLPRTGLERTVANFNARLAAGSALFLVLAVLGGLLLTRQAIQPVADAIAAARRLNPSDLSARLPRTGAGDEIDLLAATVNNLLDRLARYHEQTVQFTADASHELRGPLSSMQAAIEVTLQRPRSATEYHDLLSSLGEQCQQLADLVNNLLLLAKADAGQVELQRAPVDLAALAEEVVETYRPLAEEKGVSLDWEDEASIVCPGDRMRLLQLAMNLVDNAIKFTPAGGSVHVRLATQGTSACLTVEDTGIGITADRLPRIFERFYQGDESRSTSGTGLGLSICRWVATAHGGTIETKSQPGCGTKFTVTLPNAEVRESVPAAT
ncbi:MAG: HAMP domain-containing protein [Planctomycetia bacterium]|nr:HAMP domain-containing protein [Planctomycetia bacterium]